LMKSPPVPVGLSISARNQLSPPAMPQPFFGFRRTRGPQPSSGWTSLSVGLTQVTEAPTLTRPLVWAAAGTTVHDSSAVTTNARRIGIGIYTPLDRVRRMHLVSPDCRRLKSDPRPGENLLVDKKT